MNLALCYAFINMQMGWWILLLIKTLIVLFPACESATQAQGGVDDGKTKK